MRKPIFRTPARVIPTFALPQPTSTPMSTQDQEAIASSTLIGGGADTDRAVTTLLQTFAGQYVENLTNAGSRG